MMAVRFPEFVKRFRYPGATGGQLPADVYQFGGGWWLTVCPLCGMAHDVTVAIRLQQASYEPKCSVTYTHPHAYRQWLAEQPAARERLPLKLMKHEVLPVLEIEARPKKKQSAASKLKKQVEQDYALKIA